MTDEFRVLYPDIVQTVDMRFVWFKSDIMCSETAVDYARPGFGSADIEPLGAGRGVPFDTRKVPRSEPYEAVRTFQVAEEPDHVLVLRGYAFLVTRQWLVDTFDFFYFLGDDDVRQASAEPACVTQLPVCMTRTAAFDAWAFLVAIERATPLWDACDGIVVAAMWADFLGYKKRDGLSPYSPTAALYCTFASVAMDFYRRVYAPDRSARRAGAVRLHLQFLTEARDEAEQRFLAELVPLIEVARFANDEMHRMSRQAATTGCRGEEAEEDASAAAVREIDRMFQRLRDVPAKVWGGRATEDDAAAARLRGFNGLILTNPLPEIPPQTFIDWAVANGFYELLTAVDGVWSGGSLLRLIIETRRGAPLDATQLRAWDGSDIDVFVHVSKLHQLGLWANLYGHRFVRVDKEPKSTLFLTSTSSPCVLNIVPVKTSPRRMMEQFDIPLCTFAVDSQGRLMCTGAALASLVSSTAFIRGVDQDTSWGAGDARARYQGRIAKYMARGFLPVPCAAHVLAPPGETGYFYNQVGEEHLTFLDQWFANKRKRLRTDESSCQ